MAVVNSNPLDGKEAEIQSAYGCICLLLFDIQL